VRGGVFLKVPEGRNIGKINKKQQISPAGLPAGGHGLHACRHVNLPEAGAILSNITFSKVQNVGKG